MEIKITGTPEEVAALLLALGAPEQPAAMDPPQVASGTISVERLRIKEDSPLDVPSSEADVFNSITQLCKKHGISIARLEQEVGLGNATIRGWEKSSPRVESLKKVADYFGVTVDSLLSKQVLLTQKIKLMCAERNLSLADLEQACGLGSRTIYKWDKSSPSVDKIQRVASFFGVSIDSLLSEQEEEVAEDKSAGSIPALSSKEEVRKFGKKPMG